MNNPQILFASYEVAPFYKHGGLGDVAGSLPQALERVGLEVRVIMPYYPQQFKQLKNLITIKKDIYIQIAGQKIKYNIYQSHLPHSQVEIYFIDAPQYFDVKNIFDKYERTRFIAFSFLILDALNYLNYQPHLIHSNDWQTGMLPVILKKEKINLTHRPKTLFTIHNIGYAGRTLFKTLEKFGFRQNDFSSLKYHKINILREAILKADFISTVSPTYAKEILTREFGYDMSPALRQRKQSLFGIINGIDYDFWNPSTDSHVTRQYQSDDIKNKRVSKQTLQQKANLDQDSQPLIGMVSRLAGQKGFDILSQAFNSIMDKNLQLVILGTGAKKYEEFFKQMNKKYSSKFHAFIEFDLTLARQIYAGADMFLMPSLYEPCGLGQMIAMRYGTLPIVRHTGGLKDTVEHFQTNKYKLHKLTKSPVANIKQATGFAFEKYSSQAMLKTIKHALEVYQDKRVWNKLVSNAMQQDFSWTKSAKAYKKLYQQIIS